jgi:hypothetical protein
MWDCRPQANTAPYQAAQGQTSFNAVMPVPLRTAHPLFPGQKDPLQEGNFADHTVPFTWPLWTRMMRRTFPSFPPLFSHSLEIHRPRPSPYLSLPLRSRICPSYAYLIVCSHLHRLCFRFCPSNPTHGCPQWLGGFNIRICTAPIYPNLQPPFCPSRIILLGVIIS